MRFFTNTGMKLVAALLVGLVAMALWHAIPLRWKNMLLSQIRSDFYHPVYTGELDGLYRNPPLIITFSPRYYGEYAFELGMKGSMEAYAHPPKSLSGSLGYDLFLNDRLVASKRHCRWDKTMRYADGELYFTLFRFNVTEGVGKVTLQVRADAPFPHCGDRADCRIVILPDYVL